MKQNDVIAIIIIILFIVLALIAFGIYHLVSIARRGGSSSGSESDSRGSLADDWFLSSREIINETKRRNIYEAYNGMENGVFCGSYNKVYTDGSFEHLIWDHDWKYGIEFVNIA